MNFITGETSNSTETGTRDNSDVLTVKKVETDECNAFQVTASFITGNPGTAGSLNISGAGIVCDTKLGDFAINAAADITLSPGENKNVIVYEAIIPGTTNVLNVGKETSRFAAGYFVSINASDSLSALVMRSATTNTQTLNTTNINATLISASDTNTQKLNGLSPTGGKFIQVTPVTVTGVSESLMQGVILGTRDTFNFKPGDSYTVKMHGVFEADTKSEELEFNFRFGGGLTHDTGLFEVKDADSAEPLSWSLELSISINAPRNSIDSATSVCTFCYTNKNNKGVVGSVTTRQSPNLTLAQDFIFNAFAGFFKNSENNTVTVDRVVMTKTF